MGIFDSVKSKIGLNRGDDWDDEYDEYDDDYDEWDEDDGYEDDDYEEERPAARVRTRDRDYGSSRESSSWRRDSRDGTGSFTPLVSDADVRAQRSYDPMTRRDERTSMPEYEAVAQNYKIEPRDTSARPTSHTADALAEARAELAQLQQGSSVAPSIPRSAQVQQPSTVSRRIVTITPTSYADAERVAEAFRSGSSAVVSFTAIKPDLAKRLLDFSFGVVSVSGGTVQRIGEKVFFLSRGGAALTEAEKQQLRDSGIL